MAVCWVSPDAALTLWTLVRHCDLPEQPPELVDLHDNGG
jgi:hypothetical protein